MTQTARTKDEVAAGNRPGPAVRVRLNTFQRLMRRWNRVGPYTAAQVMLVQGAGDVERWQAATEATLRETGLGRPQFTKHATWVRFTPVERAEIVETTDSLETHLSQELNRPFIPDELPLRFFLSARADGAQHFGAVYDHWIGDSRAMRELMERIWARYRAHGAVAARLPEPLTVAAPSFNWLFRKHIGYLPRSRGIWMSLRNLARHSHGFRVNLRDPLDFRAQVLYRALPEGLIDGVHAFARAHGSSVNDCFLAALGQTMGVWTAAERARKKPKRFHYRRDQVGLGIIVDIQNAARQDLRSVFGLYLSYYTIVLAKPERRPLLVLLSEIAGRTRRIKRNFTAVKGYTALAQAEFWWRFFRRPKHRALMFHKHIPITAGISNVNMTGSWVDPRAAGNEAGGGPQILDYLRISPAGPLLPLVFTLTTIGSRLSLCTTYRVTAFGEKQVNALIDDFVGRLSAAVEGEM